MHKLWPDEPRLIAGLRAHDPHALDAVITDYSSDLLAFIRLILSGVGSVQDAEECVNDLFVAVWQEIAAFDPVQSSLRTWMTMHAKAIALARRRSLREYPGEGTVR
jgi:DNA-directed RNA polymerase specialized sigma24 family protein